MLSSIRTHDTVDPGPHLAIGRVLWVVLSAVDLDSLLVPSHLVWSATRHLRERGGKMDVGSTRPPRKEYRVDWGLGASWVRVASMDKRSHFWKG